MESGGSHRRGSDLDPMETVETLVFTLRPGTVGTWDPQVSASCLPAQCFPSTEKAMPPWPGNVVSGRLIVSKAQL